MILSRARSFGLLRKLAEPFQCKGGLLSQFMTRVNHHAPVRGVKDFGAVAQRRRVRVRKGHNPAYSWRGVRESRELASNNV